MAHTDSNEMSEYFKIRKNTSKCTKTANLDAIFDQLRLREIIIIVATRCQILRLECDFGWGSAPDPAGGAYSAPKPLAGFKGAFF